MLHSNNFLFSVFIKLPGGLGFAERPDVFTTRFVIALRYYTKIERLGFKTKQELIVRHDF